MVRRVMFTRRCVRTSWCRIQRRHAQTKCSNGQEEKENIFRIRNIGILAHIDAGKTTTTERMLYYSGLIKHMGEVHHGNTVTDYMEQERQRGITITSAAVTFNWKDHRINLIDTPGHIDFTMEVEQTLRVLDGAVIILDGSAGVEAQTVTVSRQADRYNIPRIIYVNKMDRPDVDFDMCLKSVEEKLNVEALATQLPIKKDGVLEGIANVVTMEKLLYNKQDQGTSYTRTALTEAQDGGLWESAQDMRRILTDKLSSLDDTLAETVIEKESLDMIDPQDLANALRRATIDRKGVPVLLGSSYKNVGVQPLMDGVLLYLPSPETNELHRFYRHFQNKLSARVFKIVHDRQRGPITFLRIYTGTLHKGKSLYTVQRDRSEMTGRLFVACADDYQEVQSVGPGNIAAVTGLKGTITGDLVTINAKAADEARTRMEDDEDLEIKDIERFFAPCESGMEPVFFCSVEPPSMSELPALENALAELSREDPSLRVVHDDTSDQVVLGGMGELHIEIIRERIRREYRIDVDLGGLQVAYKETIRRSERDTLAIEQIIGNTKYWVTFEMSLLPDHKAKEVLSFDMQSDTAKVMSHLPSRRLIAIRQGIEAAFRHGPKLGCPVTDVGVKIHSVMYTKETADSIFAAATSQCVKKLLKKCSPVLLEPVMRLEIVVPSEYSGKILTELSKRRAEIEHTEMRGKNKTFNVLAPLAELLDFSKKLRIVTSGYATFSMEFSHYQIMDTASESEAIRQITGF